MDKRRHERKNPIPEASQGVLDDIGMILRKRRESFGFTQKEAAANSESHTAAQISGWENGKQVMLITSLISYANSLGMEVWIQFENVEDQETE